MFYQLIDQIHTLRVIWIICMPIKMRWLVYHQWKTSVDVSAPFERGYSSMELVPSLFCQSVRYSVFSIRAWSRGLQISLSIDFLYLKIRKSTAYFGVHFLATHGKVMGRVNPSGERMLILQDSCRSDFLKFITSCTPWKVHLKL